MLDGSGNVDTASTEAITVGLSSSSTGTGVLSGTTTKNAVAGVATFDDLKINAAGEYSLMFTDANNATTTSSAFEISAGKLVFLKSPVNGNVSGPLKPAVKVEVVDDNGKVLKSATGSVSLSVAGSPSTAVSGNVAAIVNGVATFSAVQISVPGTYQLSANDDAGDATATSKTFSVAGDHLVFSKQPVKTSVNSPILFSVQLRDDRNRLVNSSDELAITLGAVVGGSNAVLSGATAAGLAKGVYSATNTTTPPWTVNLDGDYTITATSISADGGSVLPATSKTFTVSGDHLVILKQPLNTVQGEAVTVIVAEENSKNQIVKTAGANGDLAVLSLDNVADDSTQVQPTFAAAYVNGVASFTVIIQIPVNGRTAHGTYFFTATDDLQDLNGNLSVVDTIGAAITRILR